MEDSDTQVIQLPADWATAGIAGNVHGRDSVTSSGEGRRWDGKCKDCGVDLDDKRKSRCDNCKATYEANNQSTPRSRASTTKSGRVSTSTQAKLNGITANVLGVMTLALCWSQLRRMHIPDPTGDIADQMSLTTEEAIAIGAPLTRLFLNTEPGKKLAPVIVNNEDVVTAIFALWDWYKRASTIIENATQQIVVTPPRRQSPNARRRVRNNGQQVSESQAHSGDDGTAGLPPYIPPGIADIDS